MKASDHDLEQLFKVEQGHSVAAACRAVYDKGWADCEKQFYDEIAGGSAESDGQDIPNATGSVVPVALLGSGQADLTVLGDGTVVTAPGRPFSIADHFNHLLAVAHAADSEGGDL